MNIAEAVPVLTNSSLSKPPEFEYWGCCLRCKEVLGYSQHQIPLGYNKRGNKVIKYLFVKRLCACMEKDIDERREREYRLAEQNDRRPPFNTDIINPKIKDAGFKNFEKRKGTETAYQAAVQFYREFKTDEDGLLLFGPVGNGKSHLARAIQRAMEHDGYVTLFLDFPRMAEKAKDTFSKNGISVDDIIQSAISVDLLVLDEIGAGPLTSFEYKSLLFPILNGRAGKKTVYTTNLDLDRLDKWLKSDKDGEPLDEDGRLIDRIIGDCKIVKNSGSSKRQEDRRKKMGGSQ